MKIIYGILLIIMFCYSTFSQTVSIVDKTSLQPIAGARLLNISDTAIFVTTDAKGLADISSLKNSVSIYVEAEGFQSVTITYSEIQSAKFLVGLTERSYTTDEIVVSTSKFGRDIKYQPQQLDIIGSNNIEFMDQPTTAELLSSTGNILVQKSQLGGGSPILRGFEASRILLMVDGVRFNNAIFRAGHLQNVLRIDENVLERMEVLFGPGSVIYGSDALGGTMHFYTKLPVLSLTDKPKYSIGAYGRYGYAYSEKTGHLDINAGFKKFGVIASFTFSDFGDLKQGKYANPFINDLWDRTYYQGTLNGADTMIANDNVDKQISSAYHQYDILAKLLFQQSKNIQHILNFQFSNTNNVPRYDRLTELASNGTFSNAEWYYGPEKWLMGSYQLNVKSKKSFFSDASLILSYQDVEESRHNRSYKSKFRTDRTENVKVYSGNLDFNKQFGKHQLSYGLEGSYNDVKSVASKVNVKTDSIAPASTRYPVDGSNMSSFAAYVLENYMPHKNLNLTAGARFSIVNLNAKFIDTTFYHFPYTEIKQNQSALTGNLGLVYTAANDWRIAILGSTGFRSPNIDDLTKIFDTQAGVEVDVPNPDLKPEYLYSAELTLSKIFERSVKLQGTAYYSLLTNIMVTDKFQFNGQDSILYEGEMTQVVAKQNRDKGYIYGYNLSLDADITNWFTLSGTVNFTYGRVKTDSVDYPLDHIPPVFGKASMTLHLEKLRAEAYALYNGWKNIWDYNVTGEDNLSYATELGMPSWYTLNLKAAYQLQKNFSIEGGVENILDQRYRVFGSGISAPGRNYSITLRVRY
jgi:hemoglobin/transferrin/lactoferrin receptor protein